MTTRPTTPARARRLAIVRLTSLGDVIHTLPVAAAIKRQEPKSRVIWLAEERERVVLDDNPVVDEVIAVPLRRWRDMARRPSGLRQANREFRDLRRTLRELKLDAALDVQGWPHKTSPLAWLSRAPLRIGFSRAFARHPLATLFTTARVTPPPDARHIVDQNLALLGPLAIRTSDPAEFPLPRFAEAETWAAEWWHDHGLDGRRVVALLPSTRGAAKLWPVGSYRALALRLLEDPATFVLALGGPGEEKRLADVIADAPSARAFAMAPGPIPRLVGLLRRVDLAVGNDTGPIHVAAASHVPSLGLFGPTRGDRNGPYGPLGRYLQSPTREMGDIDVNAVWQAVCQMPAKAASRIFP
jgi:lipopolysaccharide heptosyltransferase I